MLGVWLIGAIFVTCAFFYGLTLRTPSWFQSEARKASEMRRMAQRVENRLITEAYRFRGGPTLEPDGSRRTGDNWRIRVTEEEATAWIAAKLGEWLANRDPPARIPPEISELQAHFGSGRAWVAGLLDDRVYAVSTGFRANEKGLWFSGARAGIGSLAFPVSWGAMGFVGMDDSGVGGWVWRLLSGREPLLPGATIRLEDGRRVRVIAVRVLPGAIEAECRTEAP
ncbi:MAG: hypothetical protein KF691_00810 [Phycisphaeraceae bacterium]|nr:hypothetical protein [Phycisphaeraceae bacterium]